jgi:hypothetical protein
MKWFEILRFFLFFKKKKKKNATKPLLKLMGIILNLFEPGNKKRLHFIVTL